jgi:Peptidase MA superfamily
MGRLTRRLAALSLWIAMAATVLAPSPAAGFSGLGASSADAQYGGQMTFRVELPGGEPDRLDLLLRFAGSEETFVAPVAASGSVAQYVWDTSTRHLTPNTLISYRWRATNAGMVTYSPAHELLYDDDRPGLNWQSARIGDATVHWYGGAESQARRFGELSAGGAQRAEQLLGHQLDGPIDIFVYDSRDDFFGALGPGAREWTGAATYPELRTVFMWLGGGPDSYLSTTIVHEVTHVVFHDATANPFHEPAKWLNEGISTWSEQQSATSERSTVAFEASGGGLFAFPAIAEQFPIGTRGSSLSYAMGATMVEMIIADHGRDAIARMAAAYRAGASDDEAIRAGTGLSADALYAAFYDAFGVPVPSPIAPAPLPPSNVDLPGGAAASGAGIPSSEQPAPSGSPGGAGSDWTDVGLLVIVGALMLAGLVAAWRVMRRVGTSDLE